MNERYRQLHNRFSAGIRTNIFSGVAFELLQVAHQSALLILLSREEYGLLGLMFSTLYLSIALAEGSGVVSIGPLIPLFTQSKHSLRYYGIRYLASQLALLILGASALWFLAERLTFLSWFNHPHSPSVYLLMAGILIEGMRMILRMFLHGVFWHKSTGIIELSSMTIFLTWTWGTYFFTAQLPLPAEILRAHIIVAGIALSAMVVQAILFYRTLTNNRPLDEHEQATFWVRCLRIRSSNYLVNISDKALFTSNLITPILSQNAGLATAGMFKFAGYMADAVRGIIRSVIGYSGVAFFASLKESPISYKQHAFRSVSSKLHKILCFSLAFITIACYIGIGNAPGEVNTILALLTPGALFFTITLIGHLSTVYHTFYVIEEKSYSIIIFRIFELLLLYLGLWLSPTASPIVMLLCVGMARLSAFALLAADGYRRWGIQPLAGLQPRFIMGSVLIALFMLLFFSSISC